MPVPHNAVPGLWAGCDPAVAVVPCSASRARTLRLDEWTGDSAIQTTTTPMSAADLTRLSHRVARRGLGLRGRMSNASRPALADPIDPDADYAAQCAGRRGLAGSQARSTISANQDLTAYIDDRPAEALHVFGGAHEVEAASGTGAAQSLVATRPPPKAGTGDRGLCQGGRRTFLHPLSFIAAQKHQLEVLSGTILSVRRLEGATRHWPRPSASSATPKSRAVHGVTGERQSRRVD